TFERAAERWTDLTTKHEMYCAGHFLQAAIAHHRATGRRSALDAAIRLADHICATFGPEARAGADGHELGSTAGRHPVTDVGARGLPDDETSDSGQTEITAEGRSPSRRRYPNRSRNRRRRARHHPPPPQRCQHRRRCRCSKRNRSRPLRRPRLRPSRCRRHPRPRRSRSKRGH
ncbi:MAG: beta-L-arabinofuranosidase domain-containing protein, partial [Gemmatimonadaceae bacterium]